MALEATITWDTRPIQASLSGHEGKGGPSMPLGTPSPTLGMNDVHSDLQGLMEWHRSHWLKVRQHVRVKASKRKARYKQRMELLNAQAQITADSVPA